MCRSSNPKSAVGHLGALALYVCRAGTVKKYKKKYHPAVSSFAEIFLNNLSLTYHYAAVLKPFNANGKDKTVVFYKTVLNQIQINKSIQIKNVDVFKLERDFYHPWWWGLSAWVVCFAFLPFCLPLRNRCLSYSHMGAWLPAVPSDALASKLEVQHL